MPHKLERSHPDGASEPLHVDFEWTFVELGMRLLALVPEASDFIAKTTSVRVDARRFGCGPEDRSDHLGRHPPRAYRQERSRTLPWRSEAQLQEVGADTQFGCPMRTSKCPQPSQLPAKLVHRLMHMHRCILRCWARPQRDRQPTARYTPTMLSAQYDTRHGYDLTSSVSNSYDCMYVILDDQGERFAGLAAARDADLADADVDALSQEARDAFEGAATEVQRAMCVMADHAKLGACNGPTSPEAIEARTRYAAARLATACAGHSLPPLESVAWIKITDRTQCGGVA